MEKVEKISQLLTMRDNLLQVAADSLHSLNGPFKGHCLFSCLFGKLLKLL